MDNVSHSLVALVLARAGVNRMAPDATAVLLISANLPDIDVVAALGGALPYLEAHRAYTHSLLGLPFMAALSVLLVAAIRTRWPPFKAPFLVACIGLVSHLLLDWTNSYGIRLLLPFSSRWFHLDWNNLTDYVFVAVLLFAVVWPYFGRLVRGEIGARGPVGRGAAWLGIALVAALEITRAFTHSEVLAAMNTEVYAGETAIQIVALPTAGNPLRWKTVVETSDAFEAGWISAGQRYPEDVETFRKLPRDPAIQAARDSEPFRFFEYFARFPVWSEQPGSTMGPKTTRLDLSDLRFGRPGAGSFHSIALLNAANQVLESRFTFGTGEKLGWPPDATMKQK